ncbi:hypothetical protein H5410_030975 [Solanum commersonii]|uniref:Uncharacterized protein n=1 Tax=Solanum commersonii TaxID=4109 RepID=A0A9J5YHS3_SOLCO|nr:hypothetical protein H5410_030975 [Solanum commersonii]
MFMVESCVALFETSYLTAELEFYLRTSKSLSWYLKFKWNHGHLGRKRKKKAEENEETEALASPSTLGKSPTRHTSPFVPVRKALKERIKKVMKGSRCIVDQFHDVDIYLPMVQDAKML